MLPFSLLQTNIINLTQQVYKLYLFSSDVIVLLISKYDIQNRK